jgi:hexosaminidase
VQFSCWLNNSSVVAFMSAHGMTDASQLQLYFEARVAALLGAAGKKVLIWEENAGTRDRYPSNAIVNVWKEGGGNLSVLEALVRGGATVLYTTTSWYLDWAGVAGSGRSLLNTPDEWQRYHAVDPLGNTTLTPQQQRSVLGGEVCMWSPMEDAANFFPTVFPRAAAVADVLWAPAGARTAEPAALLARMRAARCRLLARGIAAGSVEHAGSCPSTGEQAYRPPYEL